MLNAAQSYFMQKEEPVKSTLLALRSIILGCDSNITEAWKYGMPFYCYCGKMMCYLWVHRKYGQPYLGIVDGRLIDRPGLLTEKRAKMKIMLFDPLVDIPLEDVNSILKEMISLCK